MFKESCLLYKPDGQHCKVLDQDEYDRAIADGWAEDIPADWNNTPDPANPGGTLPLPAVSPVPLAKDKADKGAQKAPKATPSVLDGTVADITEHVEQVDDLRALQNLALQESNGANRAGALKAINDRIAELKA